jgi:hypothetical protein
MLPFAPPVSTRETLGFRAAALLIGAAVLDDGVVHREPGTAVTDHVLAVLVPLAVLAAAAWAYPRMRPGARALAALACGVLAIVAGVADGLRHVLIDRMSGDDLTVLLAALAGVGLTVSGAARLWRSRPRRRTHGLAAVVGGIAAAYFVVLPIGFAILATHKARSPAAAHLGRPVTVRTADGLRLAGSYVPSRNRAAVVVYGGNEAVARLLVRHGYGVLLMSPRGQGRSEGDPNLFGWEGETDVRAALTFLGARRDVDPRRIGGVGLSVGGEVLLQTAARDRRLRAVVSEGAGARSLREHLHLPGVGEVQRWATNWIAQTAAVAVLSGTAPPPDLADLTARIGARPVLLIQASGGHPDEALNAVYARRSGAERWIAPGAHTAALSTDPGGYEHRVLGFLQRAIGDETATSHWSPWRPRAAG